MRFLNQLCKNTQNVNHLPHIFAKYPYTYSDIKTPVFALPIRYHQDTTCKGSAVFI